MGDTQPRDGLDTLRSRKIHMQNTLDPISAALI